MFFCLATAGAGEGLAGGGGVAELGVFMDFLECGSNGGEAQCSLTFGSNH